MCLKLHKEAHTEHRPEQKMRQEMQTARDQGGRVGDARPEQPTELERNEFKLVPTPLRRHVSARPGLHQRAWYTKLCSCEHVNLGKSTVLARSTQKSSTQILCVMRLNKRDKKDCNWLANKKETDWRVAEPKRAENSF